MSRCAGRMATGRGPRKDSGPSQRGALRVSRALESGRRCIHPGCRVHQLAGNHHMSPCHIILRAHRRVRTDLLLLADRMAEGRRLQQAMGSIEPCNIVFLSDPVLKPTSHSVIVCDVALDSPSQLASVRAILARHRGSASTPVILRSRNLGDTALHEAKLISADLVLPPSAPDKQVVFVIQQLRKRELTLQKQQPVTDDVRSNAKSATFAFDDLFSSVKRGMALKAETLFMGGNVVLAAVGGGQITGWLDVIRTVDDITYQHSLLVAGLAAAFPIQLGMSLSGQRLMAQAALLHDIGKATVPTDIINKPGSLTAAEMAIMKTHASAGHAMLVQQGGFSPQILDIVRHHHEYLDGSGYPDALSGDQIKPLVRMMTICDIYAALIERRSYKEPKSSAQALSIMSEMRGKLDFGLLRSFEELVTAG